MSRLGSPDLRACLQVRLLSGWQARWWICACSVVVQEGALLRWGFALTASKVSAYACPPFGYEAARVLAKVKMKWRGAKNVVRALLDG